MIYTPSDNLFKYADNYLNTVIILFASCDDIDKPNFNVIITSAYNQLLHPKYVILCVNDNYNDNINIDKLSIEFPNLIIKLCPKSHADMLLCIINNTDNKYYLKESDRLIFFNAKYPLNNTITTHYELCYQLYNCDAVFINNEHNNILYQNNFQKYVNSNLSFSFKCKHITNKLSQLEKDICSVSQSNDYNPNLLYTLYYYINKLYTCCINFDFNDIYDQSIDQIDVRTIDQMENLVLNHYQFANNTSISDVIMQKYIEPRYLLHNVINIKHDVDVKYAGKIHIDLKHFNNTHILLTLTYFITYPPIVFDSIPLKINNNIHYFYPTIKDHCYKTTYIINLDNTLEDHTPIHDLYNHHYCLFQSAPTTHMSLYKFHSICSLTSYIPYFTYKLYDDNDSLNFITTHCNDILPYYNKLVPGAYKCDLFRAIYAYYYGGLYFDCKMILCDSLYTDLLKGTFFTRDMGGVGIYNAMFNILYNDRYVIRNYILHVLQNIAKEYYGESSFDPTGPTCMRKFIDTGVYTCTFDKLGALIVRTRFPKKYVVIQQYDGYYFERNYNNYHYIVLWKNHKIYNTNIVCDSKNIKNKLPLACMKSIFTHVCGFVKRNNNFIQKYITDNNIKSIVEIGCSMFDHDKLIYDNLDIQYTGYDMCDDVFNHVHHRYSSNKYTFINSNIFNDINNIIDSDLCIINYILHYLTNKTIYTILDYITKNKKFKYILISNNTKHVSIINNKVITDGNYRLLSYKTLPLKKYNPTLLFTHDTNETSYINCTSKHFIIKKKKIDN